MLNFFRKRRNYFLGVDFGTSAVKVVEISYNNQKPHLVNYGWVGFDFLIRKNDNFGSYEDKIKAYLKELIRKMNPRSRSIYVSMPGFIGLISLIEFPEMSREEIENAISFEAHKYIPTPLEEVSLSWDIVGRSNHKGNGEKKNRIQVLLVAASKKEVIRYENLVKSSSLEIKAIELETFSLVRSLVGEDNGCFLIIDIGARASNIILAEKGMVKVNRNIDMGGNEITSSIAESMNIPLERAELLKKQGKDFINNRESSIIFPPLEVISREALRIISAYKEKNPGLRVDGVILSGGTAKLKGLNEYFSKALGMAVTAGDPWRRIEVDPKIAQTVDHIGSSFSVAIGLALRGLEEYERS